MNRWDKEQSLTIASIASIAEVRAGVAVLITVGGVISRQNQSLNWQVGEVCEGMGNVYLRSERLLLNRCYNNGKSNLLICEGMGNVNFRSWRLLLTFCWAKQN